MTDLIIAAWDSRGEQRYALARQVLARCQDCADAYVLLAEEAYHAQDRLRLRELFEQGVRAGERHLGMRFMVEEAGRFWLLHGTRGYMRARLGLAGVLWDLGQRWEAIAHYVDLLRLNPDDNQGVRYALAQCLTDESADEMLGRLLRAYRWDTSATWRYTRALWLFRSFADCQQCNRAMGQAFAANMFVPEYLVGYREVPQELPPRFSVGSREEAVAYASSAIGGWQRSAGALDWLHRRWLSYRRRHASKADPET